MPFSTPTPIRNLSNDEFKEIDEHVMRAAYSAQNHLGRLCDERLYENDMAETLRDMGSVATQFPIHAIHGSFTKEYFLDLVVNHAVYELKVASGFDPKHYNQVFHYAAMLGVNYIKLLNFRPNSVKGELKCNALMPEFRYEPKWQTTDYHPLSPACDCMVDTLKDLIADWGTHLDINLYKEALVHFFTGPGLGEVRLPVYRGELLLGTQSAHTHHEGVLFAVTAYEHPGNLAKHLRSIAVNTRQRGLQWINLNGSNITIETIKSK